MMLNSRTGSYILGERSWSQGWQLFGIMCSVCSSRRFTQAQLSSLSLWKVPSLRCAEHTTERGVISKPAEVVQDDIKCFVQFQVDDVCCSSLFQQRSNPIVEGHQFCWASDSYEMMAAVDALQHGLPSHHFYFIHRSHAN